jgi:hypothetical protein
MSQTFLGQSGPTLSCATKPQTSADGRGSHYNSNKPWYKRLAAITLSLDSWSSPPQAVHYTRDEIPPAQDHSGRSIVVLVPD